jgi:hypothetical protein
MLVETSIRAARELPVGIHRCCVRIGDVSIGLSAESAEDILLDQEMEGFRTGAIDCDIEIGVAWADHLQKPTGRKVFDSGSIWTLYEDSGGLVFDFATPVLGCQPYKRLSVDRKFSTGQLRLNQECFPGAKRVCPLEYPLDELLVSNWLAAAEGRGVEVHGCGLVDSETGGHLFLGHSGAGKSTTTLLWKALRHARILSDDRIILHGHANEVCMYGTPWHGEAGFASAEKATIERIFVLEHGDRNDILLLPQAQAVAKLFARCFPPFYSHRALDSTLSFLHHITNLIPCYLYRFVPDGSSVREILDFNGRR